MKTKNKKLFAIIFTLFLIVILLVFFLSSFFYLNEIKKSKEDIQKCYFQDIKIYSVNETFRSGNNGCYEKMLKLIYPKLLVHKVEYKNKPLGIITPDTAFFVDKTALENSDAVFAYGIGEFEKESENTFEPSMSKITDKPIYAFDCGLKKEEIKELNKFADNLHFIDECIGSDNYLMYGQESSGKVHTLEQKLEELNLINKKVYLKFGIPEPHLYIDDILKYKDNITGISIITEFWSPKYIIDTINILRKLEKDFIIVSCNYFKFHEDFFMYQRPSLHTCVSITLINKNLTKKDSIYWNQKNNPANNSVNPIRGFKGFQIIFFEKIKNKLKHQ